LLFLSLFLSLLSLVVVLPTDQKSPTYVSNTCKTVRNFISYLYTEVQSTEMLSMCSSANRGPIHTLSFSNHSWILLMVYAFPANYQESNTCQIIKKKTGRPKIEESAYIPTINEPKTQPPLAPLVTALDG